MEGMAYNKRSILERFDETPTTGSKNAVESGGVKTVTDGLQGQITTLETQIGQAFYFKGSTTYANLPASGNTVNDTYYVTDNDKKCWYTWNGSAWIQSSMNQTDYDGAILQLKMDMAQVWANPGSYNAGDYVINPNDNKLYVAKTQLINQAWDASNWDQVTVTGGLSDMILVQDSQPTSAANKIWLSEQNVGEGIQVPTMDDIYDIVADEYDSTKTYAVGDHVIYDGDYYICNTAIDTAELWNSAHWTKTAVSDEITNVKQDLNNIKSALENSARLIGTSRFTVDAGTTHGASADTITPSELKTGDKYYVEVITIDPVTIDMILYEKQTGYNNKTYIISVVDGYGCIEVTAARNPVETLAIGITATQETAYDVIFNAFYAGSSLNQIINTNKSIKDVQDDIDAIEDDINELGDEIDATDAKITRENTRNIWPFNDSYTIDGSIVLGESGVDIVPAGMYTLTVNVVTSRKIELFLYGSSSGQIGYYELKVAQIIGNKAAFEVDVNEAIQRFFFRVNDSQTATISDIQLESIDWQGYRGTSGIPTLYHMPYGTPYTNKKKTLVDYTARLYSSNWEGKSIIFNGDSVTQASGYAGYVKVVNQLLRFGKVRNYAIGGTRLAHVEGKENCLIDRLSVMTGSADIIFIMANTNDYASQVPLGDPDSVDTSTYNGALNVLMSYLKTNYPTQPIIISTMLTRKLNYAEGTSTPLPIAPEEYAQCVRDRVAANHLILYDAYNLSGMDLRTSPQDGTGITDDGLHPNAAGELALGRKIAAFINAQ